MTNAPASTNHTIATIPRTDRTEVRVRLTAYRGQPLIDLRLYFRTKEGEWLPTRKGCAFPPAELPGLLAALETAHGELSG